MRNVLMIPFDGEYALIIANDNSGAIGMKKDDLVHAPYEIVGYYSFRVAVMECIAAGGEPIAVVLNNFCGNEAWGEMAKGIKKGLAELQLQDVTITGSTESNFALQQSAIGLMVLGKKTHEKEIIINDSLKLAIIGKPLVGNEVIEQADQVAPLALFQKVSRLEGVKVWPAGSKGILFEMNQMFINRKFQPDKVITDVDIVKSSGPAACFIALYDEGLEVEVKNLTGSYFHSVIFDN